MGFSGLLIKEIFFSLQGEGAHTGLPFTFIRLSGCNLRCTYCDTSYSFKGGQKMSIPEVIEAARLNPTPYVLVTGGEPLMQRNTPALVEALTATGFQVFMETHGEADVSQVAGRVHLIMDIKTPSSGECRGGFKKNLPLLTNRDEIKFVIASPEDYTWAKDTLKNLPTPCKNILFSPAMPHSDALGDFEGIAPETLAQQILSDGLPVRFQLQLHKRLNLR